MTIRAPFAVHSAGSSSGHGPERCEWELLGRIPWGFAWSNCIFLREETADYITFSGEMDVLLATGGGGQLYSVTTASLWDATVASNSAA